MWIFQVLSFPYDMIARAVLYSTSNKEILPAFKNSGVFISDFLQLASLKQKEKNKFLNKDMS